ncbi:MAG: flagellar hook assembly protein FlgD [Leptothrix sp. (in: b-proteobacteria)]
MTTSTSATGANSASTASLYSQLSGNGSTATSTADASADRFLKLLVAQMKNQDPLSPMDNAQVTSQMAQINTVAGLDKVNTSIQSMSGQFTQLQALQGAQLVGQSVMVNGNSLALNANGQAAGGFDLAGPTDTTKVEVLSPAGRVIDTIDVGAETSGRHSFIWSPATPPADTSGITFRVAATQGANQVVGTPQAVDQVMAVSNSGGSLTLDLVSGKQVAYSDVKAFGI